MADDISDLLAVLAQRGIDPNTTLDQMGAGGSPQSPEDAALAAGREQAWGRHGPRYGAAIARGNVGGAEAIAARVERDATTFARRQMLQAARGATAGERPRMPQAPGIAMAQPAPELPNMGIDYSQPAPGMPSMSQVPRNALMASGDEDFISDPMRGAGAMPQSMDQEAELAAGAPFGRALGAATGFSPAMRASQAAQRGDPLLAAGNAAMAAVPYRPVAALGALAGTYGAALASDLGLFGGPSSANAQAPSAAVDPQTRIQQLDKDIAKVTSDLTALGQRTRDSDRLYTMSQPLNLKLQQLNEERSRMQANLGTAAANTSDAEARQRRQEQEEMDRSLRRAEEARTRERARARSFDTSRVGQVWNETGGFAPMAMGMGTGAILRAAKPGRPLRNTLGESTLAGAFGYNIPLGYDAFGTPFENPERRGQEAFARELPLGHPLRTQTEEYARTLPEVNPLRRAASEEFFDLRRAAERMAFGAGEGFLGGSLGVGGVEIGGRARNALRSRAGPSAPGAPPSPAGPAPTAPSTSAPTAPSVATLGDQTPRRPLNPQESAPPAPASATPPPTVQELLRRRRRDGPIEGGHWVDPSAPPTSGEAWASPKGNKMWARDREGYFRDESGDLVRDSRGQLVTDPRRARPDWRRISSIDDIRPFTGTPDGRNALMG